MDPIFSLWFISAILAGMNKADSGEKLLRLEGLSRSGVLLPDGWRCHVDVLPDRISAILKDERGVYVGDVKATSPVDGTMTLYREWCQRDFEELVRRTGEDLKVLIVCHSSVTPRYHGLGFGLYLYERVLLAAAKNGFAIAPAGCDEGRTSAQAGDTWERLARLYPSVGSVVWGSTMGP
jgi:GNAT superfamily N-acetyltransferase